MRGTVVKYDVERGFGFVQVTGQPEQVFVHISDTNGLPSLSVGQEVSFDLQLTEKGPRAVNVRGNGRTRATEQVLRRRQASPSPLFFAIGTAITIAVMAATMAIQGLAWLWAYLLGINVATLLLYSYDKGAAHRDWLRVPEHILHWAELVGGTPAGWLGQRLLRHKSTKGPYLRIFWLIAIVQILLVAGVVYLRWA
ncbi:MAG: DUF1294 domain-containing protein [Caldilineaceae bacterium]|nr:DUF1294 domain-containing protein [Caldilineaceae bacterium]